MASEIVYRFELALSGESQDVGLLQGLDDTPAPAFVKDDLYHMFDNLPIPPTLDTEDGSPVVFWFREAGISEFSNAINAIIQELKSYDWQVIAMSLCIDTEDSLYSDEYQVAFSYSDLVEYILMERIHFDYKEISCVDPTRNNPLIFPHARSSLDSMIQSAISTTGREAPTAFPNPHQEKEL